MNNKNTALRSHKDIYVASKISAISQEIEEFCNVERYKKSTFNEAIANLEKTPAKQILDSSMLVSNNKGSLIGKVEYFTNSYATHIYEKIFKAAKPELKELLETYYLKYQIHNIISTLRCIAHELQDDIEMYLIGNKVQKEHCIKAVAYSYEEALRYFSTKFKFPKSMLKYNTIDDVMKLETTLYKWYHEQLQEFLVDKFNKSSIQIEHKKHIDVLNLKIKKLATIEEEFKSQNFIIKGGATKFDDLDDKKVDLEELDIMQKEFKSNIFKKTQRAPYGSYAMILNFMQKLELELQSLSKLLKEKAMQ